MTQQQDLSGSSELLTHYNQLSQMVAALEASAAELKNNALAPDLDVSDANRTVLDSNISLGDARKALAMLEKEIQKTCAEGGHDYVIEGADQPAQQPESQQQPNIISCFINIFKGNQAG